ncbi:hypothetical protein M408DRAFT_328632 [Serendipita vermifera MAFF 305830]|uniref:Nucleotidyltransferase family protein n=1 Tax=Serendipita vermifera MAFF 305830 TaxID=933852 RepID=A0A0C2WUI0_SERVB|nr:hypothetical protein M408DRAFT_328632 [Serendipita vermifera MAFF 305830]
MSGPSYNSILTAAGNIIEALKGVGETWCCLIGGLAVNLLGVSHYVADIDILVLRPQMDKETVQDALVYRWPYNFSLETPLTPGADFMKLFYHIPRTNHKIKVDLLFSTELDLEIPYGLQAGHFVYSGNLPLAPLYFVLYHKLMGWDIRISSPENWKRSKASQIDAPDIISLCVIAARESLIPLSKSHLGREYLYNFHSRVEAFVSWYGDDARRLFRRIGFPV